jgi:hypothetical protein
VVLDLSTREVNLQSVIDRNIRMRVANGATIVSRAKWNTFRAKLNALYLAELVTSFFGFNAMESEPTLHIKQQTEMFIGALNGNNVHEASREGGIGTNLAINTNNALVENQGNLTPSESIFQTVTEKHNEREALTKFVGTS